MKYPQVQNYLKISPKTKTYSYRRRIPAKYKEFFLKPNGKPRGKEWNESLKTKSMSLALKRGSDVNVRFEHNLLTSKQMLEQAIGTANSELDTQRSLSADTFKRMGIHPDQAPSVVDTKNEQIKFLNKREDMLRALSDYQFEVGIDVSGNPSDIDDEKYVTNNTYDQLQEQIDFLKGDRTIIKHELKVTWEAALDMYVDIKASNAGYPTNFRNIDKGVLRTQKVSKSFANLLGGGNTKMGNSFYLTYINRQHARKWMELEIKTRNASTVGRELSMLSAIINNAKVEFGNIDTDLSNYVNPFSGLRGKCDAIDALAIRRGERTEAPSRAWKPEELKQFKERLNNINADACIIAKISMFTGARLKDVSGLMVDDFVLKDEHNSQIRFRHNAFRAISKDSIERVFPLYGEMLQEVRNYLATRVDQDAKYFTPRYTKHQNSSSNCSTLLMKHVRSFSSDKTLKIHGFRDTLQSKFDAAGYAYKLSGYLIGWKNQQTVGMQKEYVQGYPQEQMLEAIKQAHSVQIWATLAED
tara:strand:- start:618 stop:2198 length:1581 start_codon:yes stop_codon:yes gene_type:complete